MTIGFPYPGYEAIAPFKVPDRNLMGIYEPRGAEPVNDERVLADGFANPHGAPPLRDAARGAKRVLVLIDDHTRGTPLPRILGYVLDELHAGGMRDEQVELLTAPGTHREMTEAELKRKLGEFHGHFPVHQHHWRNRAELHDFGRTSDGTPVTANRLLAECDFVLGIGGIVPHRVKGTSGGAKIAFPGVSGPEMMQRNQWEASTRLSETIMGVAENSMRLRMEEAARMAGLKYIVNVVVDVGHQIVGCYAGDFVAAHRAGSRKCVQTFSTPIPDRADIVLIDSHPADLDFWQSAKGIYAGTMVVKPGGSLILVAPNPEGVAANHPILLELGYRPHAELVRMAQEGKVEDWVGFAILADCAQIIDKADCIMVSPGIKRDEVERLGFRYAMWTQEAMRMALDRQGLDARVAVVRHGGHVLPVVETEQLRGSPGGP